MVSTRPFVTIRSALRTVAVIATPLAGAAPKIFQDSAMEKCD
jgi:hypothetical protein